MSRYCEKHREEKQQYLSTDRYVCRSCLAHCAEAPTPTSTGTKDFSSIERPFYTHSQLTTAVQAAVEKERNRILKIIQSLGTVAGDRSAKINETTRGLVEAIQLEVSRPSPSRPAGGDSMSMGKPAVAPLFAAPGWEDSQCARCGSSVVDEVCERCGGEGWLFGDDDMLSTPCPECDGAGAFHWCASDPEWCEAHPMPGREHTTPRGEIEDFLIERFRDRANPPSPGA